MLDQLLVKYPNGEGDALLRIENKQRQIQDDSKPVSVDDEQEGQESVNGGFGDDVGVETVAEINGVDVVTVEGKKEEECQPTSSIRHNHSNVPGRDSTYSFPHTRPTAGQKANQNHTRPRQMEGRDILPFQIAVHNRKEDLQEQVDRVDQH